MQKETGGMNKAQLVVAGLVFVVAFLWFSPSIKYDLVNYDDRDYIIDNPQMREGITVGNVLWAIRDCSHAVGEWHPLTWISLQVDVSVDRLLRGSSAIPDSEWKNYGSRLARVMHFHNVVLHAANAALLFFLICQMLRKSTSDNKVVESKYGLLLVFLLSMFWVLHPLRVEVVCWVSERKEELCCFWMLASVMLWVMADAGRSCIRGTWFVSVIAAALALLSKPTAVTLPLVLFAWDWVFLGKIRWRRILPVIGLAGMTCVLTLLSQRGALEVGSDLSLVSRLTTFFVGPLVYLRQLLWPVGLAVVYEGTTQLNVYAMIGGAALIVLMGSAVVLWFSFCARKVAGRDVRSSDSLPVFFLSLMIFAIAWCYGGLLPVLGIVKVGSPEHCDRYTYWTGCGLSVVLAMASVRAWPVLAMALRRSMSERDEHEVKKVALGVLAAVCVIFGCLTFRQMPIWRNTVSLYRNAVKSAKATEFANVLASYLEKEGPAGRAEAESCLRYCAAEHPCALASFNLAVFLLRHRESVPAPSSDEWIPCAEEEILLREVLFREPDNAKAKDLLKEIEALRKKDKHP